MAETAEYLNFHLDLLVLLQIKNNINVLEMRVCLLGVLNVHVVQLSVITDNTVSTYIILFKIKCTKIQTWYDIHARDRAYKVSLYNHEYVIT